MAVEGLTLSDCVEPLAQYEKPKAWYIRWFMHVVVRTSEQKSWKYLDHHASCHLTTEPSCLTRPPHGPIYTLGPHLFWLESMSRAPCSGTDKTGRCSLEQWPEREHCDGLSGCDEKSGKVCPCVRPSHLLMVLVGAYTFLSLQWHVATKPLSLGFFPL